MHAVPIGDDSGLVPGEIDGDTSSERMPLIQAACMLMGADRSLSPEDAVGDVMQVYDCVMEALERRKHRAFVLSIPERNLL